MKSLERRFESISERYPYWSPFTCFAEAVYKKGFSPIVIKRWFKKLIPSDDFESSEKKSLLLHLTSLSNPVRRYENGVKNPPGEVESMSP